MSDFIDCREGCGACCIILSISSYIPGMPGGKAAGERCIHLDEDYRCKLFGKAERPEVCSRFMAEEEICGKNREEAVKIMAKLEGIDYRRFL